jgi:hypothetical protein
MDEKNNEGAKDQARLQLESIIEMVDNLETAMEEEARIAIQESPLEISVRSNWHAPGETGHSIEWKILLCTGGPAVRIRGHLDGYDYPESVILEYQDWFTEWREYPLTEEQEEKLLRYAHEFYFGEER